MLSQGAVHFRNTHSSLQYLNLCDYNHKNYLILKLEHEKLIELEAYLASTN